MKTIKSILIGTMLMIAFEGMAQMPNYLKEANSDYDSKRFASASSNYYMYCKNNCDISILVKKAYSEMQAIYHSSIKGDTIGLKYIDRANNDYAILIDSSGNFKYYKNLANANYYAGLIIMKYDTSRAKFFFNKAMVSIKKYMEKYTLADIPEMSPTIIQHALDECEKPAPFNTKVDRIKK